MSLPKVTVVISTYNRALLLKRAIQSVLDQTFEDFELIIVNNASTDDTEEIIKSFEDKRICYVTHKENKGGPAARNTGIRQGQGKYIALLDDDDEWSKTKLEKQVKKMEKAPRQVGLIYVGTEIFDDQKNITMRDQYPQYKGDVFKPLLLATILGSVSSVLVRRECFDNVGFFDESLTSCQDWDMWLRISQCYEFDFVNEILARIHIHGVQISYNLESMIPGRTRMVEKYEGEFVKCPEVFVVHLKRLGKLNCINGTWGEGMGWFKRAIEVNPFEVVKIFLWFVWEFPKVKFFSPAKDFKKYRKK